MSCVVDVTEQRRIEDERRKLDKRLQLAGNRAIVNELSSTLAHELVQPLRAISNWARAAQGFADLKQGLLDTNAMNGIAEQARRALGIIKGIQDRLRNQPTQAVDVALNKVVETVGEFLEPEFRRLHSVLELQLQRDVPLVSGTPLELEQVLLNLILNALQAMQEVPVPQRSVSIRTESLHGAVRVLVTDRGPGVSEAAREQLFSHPITTRPEGLGLGLGICRSIVERHGGQLSYEPAAGGGAVFIIQLPCKP
jgi:C4-dicarboxylate-specific signal transduction histidine kinase